MIFACCSKQDSRLVTVPHLINVLQKSLWHGQMNSAGPTLLDSLHQQLPGPEILQCWFQQFCPMAQCQQQHALSSSMSHGTGSPGAQQT
jgi:hypothetical protein